MHIAWKILIIFYVYALPWAIWLRFWTPLELIFAPLIGLFMFWVCLSPYAYFGEIPAMFFLAPSLAYFITAFGLLYWWETRKKRRVDVENVV